MSSSLYHKDLTNRQWNRIKFLFEEKHKVGRPPLNPRTVLNGIMWILASGARWRDLPACYGNWNSVYHKFRQWIKQDVFKRLLQFVNTAVADSTLLEMDSTFCKIHQSASSGYKNQAIGASRGGKTTKIHVLINERMHVLNVVLSSGQTNDNELALELLADINLAGKKSTR